METTRSELVPRKKYTTKESWDESKWDDGFIGTNGRFFVKRPDFPGSSESGYALRYRVVWWLRTGEYVDRESGMNLHHVNHDFTDDRFENLIKISHSDHTVHHSTKEKIKFVCETCKIEFSLHQWEVNNGMGRWCSVPCSRKDEDRRNIARETLKKTNAKRRENRVDRFSDCHPDKKYYAFGQCYNCYLRDYKREARAAGKKY